VRSYLALFSTVFQQHLQYRVSAIAGAFTNIAFGFFRIFLLTAFYRAAGGVQPMTLPELYSYLWFGQVLFGVLPIVGLFSADAEEIRSGEVAYRLTRPVSLYGFYFARVLGQKTTALCTRSLIQVVILIVVLPLVGLSRYAMGAPDMNYLPPLLVSVFLTMILSAAIHTFVYMTGFWTISVRGSSTLVYAVTSLFSGLLVPIAFFPPALKRLAEFLPFRAIYDTPALLYNGSIDPARIGGALAHQVVWLAVIVMAGWVLARRGTARLEVAGG
jgi:ABC-2 type transport system permease protein